jgi:mannose-6-phosphate isomerase-like protein (cupin superfamily)
MKIFDFSKMKGGWFIGNFEPTAFKTENFEVSYKIHPKGEKWDLHYHEQVTEINLLTKGTMIMQGKHLKEGDIFIVQPFEIADPEFLEDCHIVCVKTPGIARDKICLKKL